MFRNIFSCFRKREDIDVREDYQKMRSSITDQSEVFDMYGKGSIAIRTNMEGSNMYVAPRENEEIRVVAFGPISDYLGNSSLPAELPPRSRKVARIGLGSSHVIFLFTGSEIAVCGKNDRGQIGLPIDPSDSENEYKNLRLTTYSEFQSKNLRVIDVAAGTNHSMFLTETTSEEQELKRLIVYV
jgi:alpha-tubulin suppressor-like RCC1 family protein